MPLGTIFVGFGAQEIDRVTKLWHVRLDVILIEKYKVKLQYY